MDESRPDSIAEESRRLQQQWRGPIPGPVESPSDRTTAPRHSNWTPQAPELPRTGRRIGWLLVAIAAGAIVGIGYYLGLPETTDPNDGGWADIAFFVSPFFAFIAGLALSAVVLVVRRLRLADVSASGVRASAVAGGCLGPVVYFVILAVFASTFDSLLYAGRGYLVIFTLPIFCGVIFALGGSLVRRRVSTAG
jgi:hypothetical protein